MHIHPPIDSHTLQHAYPCAVTDSPHPTPDATVIACPLYCSVSSDNVGVVTHSSPVLLYESPECVGMKIEDTPVAKITQCKMAGTQ
jgi:hypothetical protein